MCARRGVNAERGPWHHAVALLGQVNAQVQQSYTRPQPQWSVSVPTAGTAVED
ncbi:hypothetical protein ACWGIA_23385 [Streptomyces bobili]